MQSSEYCNEWYLHECIDVRAFSVKFALADCARHVYKKDMYYKETRIMQRGTYGDSA